jgi:Tfp pilus assembly protein PilE
MVSNNSPLESLAAFAIVFVTGVISSVAMRMYIEKAKRDAVRAA